MKKSALILGGILVLVWLPARAQESKEKESKLDLTQRYLLLETNRVSTMQKELSEAAAAGYRVRAGVGRHVLLLEKVAQPPDAYEYFLPNTNEKELSEAGAKGFRVLPQAVGMLKGEAEVVMEKQAGSAQQYEYKIQDTTRTATLDKEMIQASQQGYQVVGITLSEMFGAVSRRHILILEKPADAATRPTEEPPATPGERYRLLSTTKTSTMDNEVREATSAGYRILDASDSELTFILEKAAAPGGLSEYLLLATTKTSTMEKELNEAASKGFRLLPQTLGAVEKKLLGGFLGGGSIQTEIFAVMEKAPGSNNRHQYVLLATKRDSTMQKEVAEASRQGYEVVAMTLSYAGEYIVILEKSATP